MGLCLDYDVSVRRMKLEPALLYEEESPQPAPVIGSVLVMLPEALV